MSENLRPSPSATDPRAQRTRNRLGDALIALIQEKSFDGVTVQDVLDRAGVSRSTFYAHFRDKHDLLLSDVDAFADGVALHLVRSRDRSERVAPVEELFTHVAEMEPLRRALANTQEFHDVWELVEAHLARGIEARLEQIARAGAISPAQRAPLAHAAAGSFMALLEWWLRASAPPTPREMDALFHRQFWSGASAAG